MNTHLVVGRFAIEDVFGIFACIEGTIGDKFVARQNEHERVQSCRCLQIEVVIQIASDRANQFPSTNNVRPNPPTPLMHMHKRGVCVKSGSRKLICETWAADTSKPNRGLTSSKIHLNRAQN